MKQNRWYSDLWKDLWTVLVLVGILWDTYNILLFSLALIWIAVLYVWKRIVISRGGKRIISEHEQCLDLGSVHVLGDSMAVSACWDMADSTTLQVPMGVYSVSVRIQGAAEGGHVAAVSLSNGELTQPITRESADVFVDGAFLMIVDPGCDSDGLTSKVRGALIQGMMETYGRNYKNYVSLVDQKGVVRGVAVQSGNGDGQYSIVTDKGSNGNVRVSCDFYEFLRAPPDE